MIRGRSRSSIQGGLGGRARRRKVDMSNRGGGGRRRREEKEGGGGGCGDRRVLQAVGEHIA